MELAEADAPSGVEIAKQERSFDRLARLGIVAWEQVLMYLPTGYRDFTRVRDILPTPFETEFPVEKACYKLVTTSFPNKDGIKPPRATIKVTDGYTTAKLVAFGNLWPWMEISKDSNILVEAVLDLYNNQVQVKNPVYVPYWMDGKVIPSYRGKKGRTKHESIAPEFIYEKTREALALHLDGTVHFILRHFPGMDEEAVVRRAGIAFPNLRSMLLAIHSPKSVEQGEQGLKAARAIAAFELVYKAQLQSIKKPNPKSVFNIRQKVVDELISRFPYPLTADQSNGIAEIVADLKQPYPMNRLLSGDVGYGKTEVGIIPALAANVAGAKVAILCPSTLIVEQWVEKIHGYGKFKVIAVTGNSKLKPADLKDNPILVGTTALANRLEKMKWVPDFSILDEQQKHGRSHKEKMVGSHTNLLEATATCQPRTGALVFYGGMSETILNQCPVEKKITTRIVTQAEKGRMFDHMKRVLAEVPDAQFAVVYPNLDKGDGKTNLQEASKVWERLFPGQTAVLHGKMKDHEKAEVVQKMKNKEFRILLCTILIETGITLPSLRGMVVVGANRMGVSALHQLRGRLARHGGTGYYYMYLPEDVEDEETLARLNLLVDYTDGFVLAEKDAEMRGYGSLDEDDTDQSGVSCSAMFYNVRLMPQDISTALAAK